MLKPGASQVVTYEPDGFTSPRWLGAIGKVNGLNWSYSCSGGAKQMGCVLNMDGSYRSEALNPGRIVKISRGASAPWTGILDEPTPLDSGDGWNITAHGAGAAGTAFLTDTRKYTLDAPVEAAIDRGLFWVDPGITSGYLPPLTPPTNSTRSDDGCVLRDASSLVIDSHVVSGDVGSDVAGFAIPVGTRIVSVDPGNSFVMSSSAAFPQSKSKKSPDPDVATKTLNITTRVAGQPQIAPFSTDITSWMNQITTPAGLLWYVDRYMKVSVFPYPTTPTRLLVTPDPVARTIANDITSLIICYQEVVPHVKGKNTNVIAYTELTNQAGRKAHGRVEAFLDISAQAGNNSVYTEDQAQAIGRNILLRYQRAAFASAFTVRDGQYLTLGGQPVDLGSEDANGVVVKLVYSASGGIGGEVTGDPVTFVVGEYQYNEDSLTAQITPLQSYRTDITVLPEVLNPRLRSFLAQG